MSERFIRDVTHQVGIARQVLAELGDESKTTIELRSPPGYCRHPHITIYRNTAVVECRDCKAWLDPVKVLEEYADNERALEYSRREVRRLREQLDELKREERNIKARIKRARGAADRA